jgi:hypothetical protein
VELEPGRVWVVNGTGLEGVLVEVPTGLRASTITMTDHCGDPAPFDSDPLRPGIHRVPVPRSGLVELRVV